MSLRRQQEPQRIRQTPRPGRLVVWRLLLLDITQILADPVAFLLQQVARPAQCGEVAAGILVDPLAIGAGVGALVSAGVEVDLAAREGRALDVWNDRLL